MARRLLARWLRAAALVWLSQCAPSPLRRSAELLRAERSLPSSQPSSAAQHAVAAGFEGRWVDPAGARVVIASRNGALAVQYESGRGPFVAQQTGPTALQVEFTDDPGCCAGALVDAQTIRWSNAGVWRRDRREITGRWVDPGGALVLIERQNSSLIVRYAQGRGPFEGALEPDGSLVVRFVDDPGCCAGHFDGANSIRWSNHGSWQRAEGR